MAYLDRVATGNQVLLDGESSYKTSREGSRWYVTNPTANTAVTAQTSFAATTPFLSFETDANTRMVLNSVILAQTGTAAGGTITVIFATDTVIRSTGGTAITPAPTSREATGSTAVTVKHTVTASAAPATVRYFCPIRLPVDTGATSQVLVSDAYIIGASSSILIYAFAATTGPSFFFNVEWVEERSST